MRRLAGTPLRIIFDFSSQKELLALNTKDADALEQTLVQLAQTGQGDIVPMIGYINGFRLRVGKTRAEFYVNQKDQILGVTRVFYRQEGYKTKGRSRR